MEMKFKAPDQPFYLLVLRPAGCVYVKKPINISTQDIVNATQGSLCMCTLYTSGWYKQTSLAPEHLHVLTGL